MNHVSTSIYKYKVVSVNYTLAPIIAYSKTFTLLPSAFHQYNH